MKIWGQMNASPLNVRIEGYWDKFHNVITTGDLRPVVNEVKVGNKNCGNCIKVDRDLSDFKVV